MQEERKKGKKIDESEDEGIRDSNSVKIEKMQRMISRINEKVKKLENMVENMLNIHNSQMEKIINMITELKEGKINKGKQEKSNMNVYTSDGSDNEFY